MKVYALAIALVVCIIQNASADSNVIEDFPLAPLIRIIHRQIENVKGYANKKGTPEALKCIEPAQQELLKLFDKGSAGIRKCYSAGGTEEQINKCSLKVQDSTFLEALEISESGAACVNNA